MKGLDSSKEITDQGPRVSPIHLIAGTCADSEKKEIAMADIKVKVFIMIKLVFENIQNMKFLSFLRSCSMASGVKSSFFSFG